MQTRTGSNLAGLHLVAAALCALFALAVALPARADDPVEYYATVDRDRCAIDETIRLQVTLSFSSEPESIELPATPDFDVVSQGRSDQMSFSFGSGGSLSKRIRNYTLVLQPKRQGKLAIEPGVVTAGGKRYQTGKLLVEVGPPGSGSPRVAQPQQGQRSPFGGMMPPGFPPMPGFDDDWDPFASMLGGGPQASESDLFLRATVDKTEVYAGEQVTLSIYLMARVDVSHVEALKMPRLDGFWSEQIEQPKQITGQIKNIDGVPYRAYLIQRRALFPIRAGELQIEPAQLDVVTGGGPFGGGRKYSRKSLGAKITVKPLPDGAPAGFAQGNVGKWSLTAEATPTEVTLGAPVTLKLTTSGTGNLRGVEVPALPKIDGFKIFDPTRSEKPEIQGRRYGGAKTVEYVLVPERPGSFTVPPLAFAYFDPESGRYESTQTGPIQLTVLQGQGSVAAATPGVPGGTDGAAAPEAGGLKPVRPVAVAAPSAPIYERPWFFAALALPAVALAGALIAPRVRGGERKEKRSSRKAKAAGAPKLSRLGSLAAAGDPAVFAECDRLLHELAGTRLGRNVAGVSRDELASLLRGAGVEAEAIEALRGALELCDTARWAPGALPADAATLVVERTERAAAALSGGAA